MSSEKGVLFSWLAAVHAQSQSRLAKLPESPALAELLHIKQEFSWSDQCYREVKLLGEASGLHFKDYVRNLPDVIGRPGDCVMNPIILDKVKMEKVCSPEEIAGADTEPKGNRENESVGSTSGSGFYGFFPHDTSTRRWCEADEWWNHIFVPLPMDRMHDGHGRCKRGFTPPK
ncbi:hypothetical protein M758_1G175200 [Ceratodon purpureus]|nr:hypothetical protein M758_1G175200 [Ceratodon purpureus]KAG0630390.1 hypothetical protein M758_1G175200 [Ceratodon purpureus]KAG0630391.1 hypothetical protein M758_1G175200 [Ceratodon purpureus]